MTRTLIIARHVLQESVRRRVFVIVLVLTLLFLALLTLATVEAFNAASTFGGDRGPINAQQVTSVTLTGLGMFSSLFLATVLAVFLTLGAVRGDAERGLLQPLVVRPLGRSELLLGRFVGAAAVCSVYVVGLYAIVLLIVHQAGGRWPDNVVGPGLALAGAVVIIVALSLLGSVFLSATANGIAMFMLYGAGLVLGLLATIGAALDAHTVQTIAHDLSIALPFEGLYQAGLHALGSNQSGLAGVSSTSGPLARRTPAESALICGLSSTRWSSRCWRMPGLRVATSRGPSASPTPADPHPLEQVVADAQRVGHRRQRRVDRPDAREEARVDDVQVVQLMRLAVDVQHRRCGMGAEAARPRLVRDARHGDLVLEVGVMGQQVVVVHAEVPEHRLEHIEQPVPGLVVGRLIGDRDHALVLDGDAVLGAREILRREPEVDRVLGDVLQRPGWREQRLAGLLATEHRRL